MANGTTTVERPGRGQAAYGMSGRETLAVGFFVVGLVAVLAYALLAVWPSTAIRNGEIVWVGLTESSALAIVMIAGALGSFVHVATSFASYAGNRSLTSSWAWWFLLRPAIGAAMAVIAYFVIRSGVLLDGALGSDVSPFGIAGLSGMVGLASKQIVDKMRNVSDTAFNTARDEQRADKL